MIARDLVLKGTPVFAKFHRTAVVEFVLFSNVFILSCVYCNLLLVITRAM